MSLSLEAVPVRGSETLPATFDPAFGLVQPRQLRLHSVFERQRAAFLAQPYPSLEQRRQALDLLEALVRDNLAAIQAAICKDFCSRSEDETLIAEVMGTLKCISYARRHLKAWMKPRRRPVDINFAPATARLLPQPLGVVGIMSPWNFPFGLVMKPLVSALAAGNRVMIKPSELTPTVSALLRELLARAFDDSQVCVIEGDADVARAFIELPFNHLMFTGSTHIGRSVMAAAAPKLTPLTLELGGKSPVIIDGHIDLQRAVTSIVTGKLLNGGQSCTAPDYVLVPRGRLGEFRERYLATVRRMYPDPIGSPDYSSIINERHYGRLQRYLDDAASRGAELAPAYPELKSLPQTRKLLPQLVINPPPEAAIMQEEIFGPLLCALPYGELGEALDFINQRPRPLALYVFTDDRRLEDEVLRNTVAGGVTVNDTLLHYTQESLPFGGVGNSGFGAYHGERGFETFSHLKPVFRQARFNSLGLLRAPYTSRSRWLLNTLIRMS